MGVARMRLQTLRGCQNPELENFIVRHELLHGLGFSNHLRGSEYKQHVLYRHTGYLGELFTDKQFAIIDRLVNDPKATNM